MRLWERLFFAIERAMPPGATIERVLREQRPDLLLVTPLLYFGSQQVEYVRAARAMGIPTVLGVGSWDHLTTKGRIYEIPDRVIVWNEFQRKEAAELHGVPPDRVSVTGAQAFDHWFVQRPSTTREAFCAKVGVPADRPLLLYLCSSQFITPYEVGFVQRWIKAVRSAPDPAVRTASILIRPHPQNAAQWNRFRRVSVRRCRHLAPRRRESGQHRGARRVLRLDVPQRRDGRHQHQRAESSRASSDGRCSPC
jgi:hypothetical protein